MQTKTGKEELGTDRQKPGFSGMRGIYAAVLLSACTTDSVPDEAFEAPAGNFPLLGNVPDRPTFSSSKDTTRQQKRLQREHDQATKKQDDVIKSITP